MRTSKNTIIADDCEGILEDLKSPFKRLANKTIIITGSNGFLCSYIVDIIAFWNIRNEDNTCKIIALDNSKTGLPERLSHLENRPDIIFLNHDISKALEIAGNIDWIIHGASIASPIKYRQFPLETIDVNVGGTRNMLDLAKEKQSSGIIVMSTSEIYGDPDPKHIPTSEKYRGYVSCTGPRACYAESKRLAETLCAIYHQQFGTPVKVIRPFSVFGPGQQLNDKRIIPDLITAALNNQDFTLFSDGAATRSFCYISDVASAILEILTNDSTNGEAYNVGNDEIEISIRDLTQRMAEVSSEVLGWNRNITFAKHEDPEYTTDSPQRRCPDLTKTKSSINWTPKVNLRKGLTRTLQSYSEQLTT